MSSEVAERERISIVDDLDNTDEEIRRLAVERLLALPAEEAIPRLVAVLGDSSWRVRKAAVGRLVACSHSDRVVAELISALSDGENTGRRNSAVEALVARGRDAIPALIDALASDDVDVRKLVVDSVAGIGDPSACSAIIALLDDPDPNVRGVAADALGVLGTDYVAEPLIRSAVCAGEDRLVRLSALRSLARLEIPMGPDDLTSILDDTVLCPAGLALLGYGEGEGGLECLMKGLGSGSRAAREAAMESVLRLLANADGARASKIVDQVREAARASEGLVAGAIERLEEGDLAVRLTLIQFLGLVGAAESVIPILYAGRDEAIAEVAHSTLEALGEVAEAAIDEGWSGLDVQLRSDACGLLSRTSGERGSARLMAALDEVDGELRAAAARALGARRHAEALPAFVRRLEAAAQEDDFEAEEELNALVDAMVALASPDAPGGGALTAQAVELLSERLDGAGETVRLSIAAVLGRIGRSEDAELVASLLKDPSARVRRAAVEALARLEPGMASEPLRLALADESPVVRIAAAGALGASENPKVIDDLKRLLQDEDARVCSAALRAIGTQAAHWQDPSMVSDAVTMLQGALAGDGMVILAGLEALRCVGGREAASAAVRALDSEEPEVIQAAVSCIAQHGDASIVTELLSLVAHPSWGVRADVIQTLADRSVAQAVPAILRRLETEQDSFVRDTILRALKRLEA